VVKRSWNLSDRYGAWDKFLSFDLGDHGMLCNLARRVFMVAIIAAALGMGGCGARHYDVSGKVMLNDALIDKPDGHIVFVGPKGEQVQATINPDGTYRASGVAEGPNKVVVYYLSAKFKAAKAKLGKIPPKDLQLPPTYLTPSKYADADTTDITVTVDKETVFDIKMTGPAIQ
jgi:hypothetical protein